MRFLWNIYSECYRLVMIALLTMVMATFFMTVGCGLTLYILANNADLVVKLAEAKKVIDKVSWVKP